MHTHPDKFKLDNKFGTSVYIHTKYSLWCHARKISARTTKIAYKNFDMNFTSISFLSFRSRPALSPYLLSHGMRFSLVFRYLFVPWSMRCEIAKLGVIVWAGKRCCSCQFCENLVLHISYVVCVFRAIVSLSTSLSFTYS